MQILQRGPVARNDRRRQACARTGRCAHVRSHLNLMVSGDRLAVPLFRCQWLHSSRIPSNFLADRRWRLMFVSTSFAHRTLQFFFHRTVIDGELGAFVSSIASSLFFFCQLGAPASLRSASGRLGAPMQKRTKRRPRSAVFVKAKLQKRRPASRLSSYAESFLPLRQATCA